MSEAGECRQRIHRRHVVAGAIKHFGCSHERFMERCCVRQPVYRRQVAMYVSRELGHTYPQIARTFGRDHSTVFHAVQKIGKLLKSGDEATTRDVRGVFERARAEADLDQAAMRARPSPSSQRSPNPREAVRELRDVHRRWLRRAPDEWAPMPLWAGCPATMDLLKWGLLQTRETTAEAGIVSTVSTSWRRTPAGLAALHALAEERRDA